MSAPAPLVVGPLTIPRAELQLSFARSGAAGGQNVNKVNSKAVLHWDVTLSPSLPQDVRARFLAAFATRITKEGVLVLMSEVHRDQPRNVEDCLDKLATMLKSVLRPPKKRRPTRPTRSSVKRRLNDKAAHKDKKRSRGTQDDG